MSGSFRGGVLRIVATVLLCVCGTTKAQPGVEPPNLIFILTDDQGVDAIEGRAWPNDLRVSTPNLATLAEQGRIFTNARVAPICAPTRAALMTGRSAFRTGVTGVPGGTSQRDLLTMQSHEFTIAELLREMGYFNILIDKWHCGTTEGQSPFDQGFQLFRAVENYMHLDAPERMGDEHVSRSVDLAIHDVRKRPEADEPYALFFWTIDAHDRERWTQGRTEFPWWPVRPELLPSGEPYYTPRNDRPRNRYRAVIEALDTEIGRLLRELNVVDESGLYRPESNTVVIVMSDNGTPEQVARDSTHAKQSLYDGGVRVPLFVFGANVPADGAIVKRPVSAVDLFDTIADIVRAREELRARSIRDSMSFADTIGWTSQRPARGYTLSHRGNASPTRHRVALTDKRFKLITSAADTGFTAFQDDELYDLREDPREQYNLLRDLNDDVIEVYARMKDEVPNHWPSAISRPLPNQIDLPVRERLAIDSRSVLADTRHAPVGFAGGTEARVLVRFDLSLLEQSLPQGRSWDDVTAAQLIVSFDRESLSQSETDTGLIVARAMTVNWYDLPPQWSEISDAFAPSGNCGEVDFAPHVVPFTSDGQWGVPLPPGALVSLGQRQDLLSLLDTWLRDPDSNHGLVLVPTYIPDLPGDQRVFLNINRVMLRLTVRDVPFPG